MTHHPTRRRERIYKEQFKDQSDQTKIGYCGKQYKDETFPSSSLTGKINMYYFHFIYSFQFIHYYLLFLRLERQQTHLELAPEWRCPDSASRPATIEITMGEPYVKFVNFGGFYRLILRIFCDRIYSKYYQMVWIFIHTIHIPYLNEYIRIKRYAKFQISSSILNFSNIGVVACYALY